MTENTWPKEVQDYLNGKLDWEAVKGVVFAYMTYYAGDDEAHEVAERLKKAGAPDFQYRNMQLNQPVEQGPIMYPYPSEM